jgi:hypothetical protein
MAQNPLKSVNNYLNTNIYYYLETSGGQSSNLCLNVLYQCYLDICGSLRLLFSYMLFYFKNIDNFKWALTFSECSNGWPVATIFMHAAK